MKPIQVVALGNRIMADDGAGPRVLDMLQGIRWPAGVHFYNAETAGLGQLSLLRRDGLILLVDALRSGRPPGTVIRISPHSLELLSDTFSLHDLHLLHLAKRFFPARLQDFRIYGIEPSSLSPGTGLSKQVTCGLPLLAYLLAKDIIRYAGSGVC
jgi:hydrogenase maturation protease